MKICKYSFESQLYTNWFSWTYDYWKSSTKFTWIPATKKIALQNDSYSPRIRENDSYSPRIRQLQCKNSRKRQAECRANGEFWVYKNKTLGYHWRYENRCAYVVCVSTTRCVLKFYYNAMWHYLKLSAHYVLNFTYIAKYLMFFLVLLIL